MNETYEALTRASERTLSPENAKKLGQFFRGFTPAACPLLLLDYDGTLAPFHVDRFQAAPWPDVRDLLQHIQNQKKTRMVVITGRPADEIAPLLGLNAPLEVWGLHGFERLYPDGRREQEHLPDAVDRQLDKLRAQLDRDSFGGLFESKPNAAVVHWRGATPAQAAHIEQHTCALFEPAAQIPGFRLLPFECGLELRAGRDKGAAVELLMAETVAHAPAAYLGDDLTDETAFRAIEDRGLSVLVRKEWRETAADVWLKPPEELKVFLQNWANAAERSESLSPLVP